MTNTSQIMRPPQRPPRLDTLMWENGSSQRVFDLLLSGVGPAPGGKYRHWDTQRRVPPPEGYTAEEYWAALKLARHQFQRELPLLDHHGNPFSYTVCDPLLEMLHYIDRFTSGSVELPKQTTNPETKDRYIINALIEEAITSSQLEGAAATREVAKEMIRTGRKPINKDELMIFNNYRAMRHVQLIRRNVLTFDEIIKLHSIMVHSPKGASLGRLRTDADEIIVQYRDTVVFRPPPSGEVDERIDRLCAFANETHEGFLHPVIKAIVLHFWLAYIHPFTDGNGRTARALFYWAMLSQGFWLFEYISISSLLKKGPAKYARSFLYSETDDNDLTYFLLAQLGVIKRAVEALYEYARRKAKEIREVLSVLQTSDLFNHRQLALLSHAIRHPGQRYTIKSHCQSHRIAYQTGRTDLLGLAEQGLLDQARIRNAYVFYPAKDLQDRLRNINTASDYKSDRV